jgi:flagellar assembly protein FliH
MEPRGFAPDHRFSPRGAPAGADEIEPPVDPLEEAFARGLAEGEELAAEAYRAQLADVQARFAGLERALAELACEETEILRARLTETVAALCEDTLRPLALDRDALAARVERAAAMLQRSADQRRVRLHPDDLELLRPVIGERLALEADPSLVRGALRIETEDGGIEDGPEIWARAIREALGLC